MVIVTGAAGFIGSNLVSRLNFQGIQKIVLVDAFDNEAKNKNLLNKDYIARIHRDDFFTWFDLNHQKVKFIFTWAPEPTQLNSTKRYSTG